MELLSMKGGYISKRNFNYGIDYDLQYKIQANYPSPDWDFARSFYSERHKITMSAIRLSEKIKKELDIDVFPLIRTCAIKGYSQDGQMQFYMLGINTHCYYYFDFPRKWYDKKGVVLELGLCNNDNMITIKDK